MDSEVRAVVRRLKNATSEARGMMKSRSLSGDSVGGCSCAVESISVIFADCRSEPKYSAGGSFAFEFAWGVSNVSLVGVVGESRVRSRRPSWMLFPLASAQIGDIACFNRCKVGLGGMTSIAGKVKGDLKPNARGVRRGEAGPRVDSAARGTSSSSDSDVSGSASESVVPV